MGEELGQTNRTWNRINWVHVESQVFLEFVLVISS